VLVHFVGHFYCVRLLRAPMLQRTIYAKQKAPPVWAAPGKE
jgi:hypothetical protein